MHRGIYFFRENSENYIYRNVVNTYMNEIVVELDKLRQSISTKCKAHIYPSTTKHCRDAIELIYYDPFFTAKEIEKIIEEIVSLGVTKDQIKIVPSEDEIKIVTTIYANQIKAFGIDLNNLAKDIQNAIGSTYHLTFRAIKGAENHLSIRYYLNYADLKELERIPKLIEVITNFANIYGKKLHIVRDYDDNSIWFSITV